MDTMYESGCMPGTEYKFTIYEKNDDIIESITLVVNKIYGAMFDIVSDVTSIHGCP